ncbi:phosphoribosyltransferase [Nakamurella sp. GG22]
MALWSTPRRFADRVQAGRHLASLLTGYAGRDDVVVLGLPRGGVPVAAEVARALDAPLDVLVVRKLGAPGRPELAIGAIADVGTAVEMVTNPQILERLGVSPAEFDEVYRRELTELRRRTAGYRGSRPPVAVDGKVVIVVDDGLATGATMRAAVAAIRRHRPAKLVVAVPVGPQQQDGAWGEDVEVVCALTPALFSAVHQGYDDFGQTTDEQVLAALAGAPTRSNPPSTDGQGGPERGRAE